MKYLPWPTALWNSEDSWHLRMNKNVKSVNVGDSVTVAKLYL